ncbi:MAG: hypothetical protein IJD18_04600 [Clostridia bacterium]|nr:hypothetical protein [Clostridia bacterium]
MLLNELLQKDVVFDGQFVGKLDGICGQKGQPCLLLVQDKTFGVDKIKVKNVIIATNLHQVDAPTPMLHLSKKVYDTNGKLLGQIADAELGSTLKLKSLLLSNGTKIALSQIVANNDIVTVRANKPKKKVAPKTPLLTMDKNTQQNNVAQVDLTAQNVDELDDNQARRQTRDDTSMQIATADVDSKNNFGVNIAPKRKSGDFSFLVGKVVDKNIFNYLGELMIREGDVVTRNVYIKARMFGKLTELCLHTK